MMIVYWSDLQNLYNARFLWTGNEYYRIYIILNTILLELVTDLADLWDKPSEKFLKFAEFIFTNRTKDSCHNPSFKSHLLRILYTLNSKCIDSMNGNYIKDPEVKNIQEFDSLTIPTIITNYQENFGCTWWIKMLLVLNLNQ